LLVEILDADLQGAQRLEVLSGHFQLHFAAPQTIGCGFIAAVGFRSLVEANRRFQNKKHIVSGVANILDSFTDLLRLGQSVIYGCAELLHQLLQILIELHLSSSYAQ
jgi:hypothetical protein